MSATEPYDGGDSGSGMANMRLAFSNEGSAVYRPIMPPCTTTAAVNENNTETGNFDQVVISSSGGVGGFNRGLMNPVEPMKRKRGRPRKYYTPAGDQLQPGLQYPPHAISKKPRGRPPGSGGKTQLAVNALGSTGVGFRPHVMIVKAGEDVVSKIMSFSQNGIAVCVLSANGVVSNVTLRQAARGVVTYEGCFEILSLSGSFLHSESNGQSIGIGGLNISLSTTDGAVIGGSMAGVLRAASFVQVIVGSFIAEDRKESKLPNQPEIPSAPPNFVTGSPLSHSIGTFR